MVRSNFLLWTLAIIGATYSSCPWAEDNDALPRAPDRILDSRSHLEAFEVDDSQGYLTSDVGGPISDQQSLKAGIRGPALLEDFIFRQKLTHFDHERVPERAVHARGVGAHGYFTSYENFGNITAASFLSAKDKKTPISYTDEGNFDIVGNNIPVFFIQDAIQFPDLIHAVKPAPNNEIPQAGSAHNSAWDFFSQQTSTLHTLFWAMAGYGIPRSFRHVDGFGIHTFRLVTDNGETKLVKWHFKSKQGRASLIWEEAQAISGKNPDFHRQDLYDAIENGHYPEWELNIQIINEKDALAFGFDVLDPTKIIPEEIAPLHPLGVLRLDVNPTNYFAETEQIMFQPGHIVRGIDYTEDPLLQGRIFSYLDTQLNRHGGPNFEQLPINRPVVPIHNNNRDGAAQNSIHKNKAPYTPNTLNNGFPAQANQAHGRGFFTSPGRSTSGFLVRERSPTFDDHWSQPRLFYNSISEVEQQFLVNAIRFELIHVHPTIQRNVLAQMNKISHDVAKRVARALGLEVPAPNTTYYHGNKTAGLRIFGERLPTIAGLTVGILASTEANRSLDQAQALRSAFEQAKVNAVVLAETLGHGVDQTYSAVNAAGFDGIIVADGADPLFNKQQASPLYPNGRPTQIIRDGYNWGKPLGFLGSAQSIIEQAGAVRGPGVYQGADVKSLADSMRDGLAVFKFTNRFVLDK